MYITEQRRQLIPYIANTIYCRRNLQKKIIGLIAFLHSPILTLDFDSISIDTMGFVDRC